MIPNNRVDHDGNVLLNRGSGDFSGRWVFEPFWITESTPCFAIVHYEAKWDVETNDLILCDAHVAEIKFFDDDGEELEVGLQQQQFVENCKTEIVRHFLQECVEFVHEFEMGEL